MPHGNHPHRRGAAADTMAGGRRGLVWAWPVPDPAALGRWLRAGIAQEVEQRRLFPWLAVAYGAGILLAFAADGPLSLGPPLLGVFAGVAASVALRTRLAALAAALAVTALFAGFGAAVLRMQNVAAPVLPDLALARISGFVESVEERRTGGRVVVRVTTGDQVPPASRPERVRVTLRDLGGATPGDYVSGTMRLLPPPEAARPGGYDFARDAYFKGIGAVGSVSGRLTRIDPPPVPRPFGLAVAAAIDTARNRLTRRIADTIGGGAGAVAAALITGKRGLIDDHSNDVLRAAGIYHIVSISGLHMVLAAGFFFWVTRALLALSPHAALHWPIKKIAAASGMLGALVYDVFSGSDVATERSLCMILVMQGAILFDRPALSLRNLALSALVVLTFEPESLLGPSLQMSYAAVAGLIAMAEWQRARRPPSGDETPLGRALGWAVAAIVGTIATTLVASVATGPFGAYHFQNLQPYGLIGNAVTLPLVSLVVMPAALLGVVAFPFGLDRPIWLLMGWAVEAVLALSEWVSRIPGSIVIVPAYGVGALALMVVALLVGTLCVSGLRWLALAPAAFGLWTAGTAPRADLYVARDGSAAAIRGPDGRLVVVGRASAFTAEQWLRADGDSRRFAAGLRGSARCDAIGCVVALPDGRRVAYTEDRRGFERDCARAAIVLSRLAAPAGCAAALVIDRAFLARHGAVAIRRDTAGFTVATARTPGDTRPWRRPARPIPLPAAAAPSDRDQPSAARPPFDARRAPRTGGPPGASPSPNASPQRGLGRPPETGLPGEPGADPPAALPDPTGSPDAADPGAASDDDLGAQ